MQSNLSMYRKAAGYSQTELAKMVDCRRETICNLEKGKYNPSLTLAYRIVNAINLSPKTKIEFLVEDVFPNDAQIVVQLVKGLSD